MEQDRPIEVLVEEALRRCIAVVTMIILREKTVPLAQAQRYFTDADIFREVS